MAKVLVVDDEEMICEEFRDILEEDHHIVDTARNGHEAIHKVQAQHYDLIFLDVLMPRMEGREVFEKIKKISQVPVAIMSGYLPPNKEKEILSLGAIACFKKPLDLDRIKKLLSSIKEKK